MNNQVQNEIKTLINTKKWDEIKTKTINLLSPDIADIIKALNGNEALILLRLLPRNIQSDVFSELDFEMQLHLINNIDEQQLKQIIEELSPDERTDLFETLSPKLTQKLLNLISSEKKEEILKFLGYPENSVGRLMTTEYVAVKLNWTIEKAIKHIRKWGKDAETIDVIYVVDDDWKLLDDIPIRRIILSDSNQLINDIMDHHFVAVNAYEDQENAIKLFRKYNLVATPVVDAENYFLGIITVDDILDVLQEENTEDFAKIGAVNVETKDLNFITDLKDVAIGKIYKSRITWLFALLIMDLLTGGIIQSFEGTIAKYVVLVTFLPVLVDTAGNAGSQTATLIIRAMALGTVQKKDWLFLLCKEFFVATLIGLTMGAGISIMGFVRGKSVTLALVVVVSMIVNVIIGSLIGILLPFIFSKFKQDPATASTPLITTLADIVGTGIFLSIACLILG